MKKKLKKKLNARVKEPMVPIPANVGFSSVAVRPCPSCGHCPTCGRVASLGITSGTTWIGTPQVYIGDPPLQTYTAGTHNNQNNGTIGTFCGQNN